MSAVFSHEFSVTDANVDQNRHLNNVVYVQWMQDVAVLHAAAVGCMQATQRLGASWVVRSHRVEYLQPAFAGDRIEAQTWVVNVRRVRSLRRYRFLRLPDRTLLARGETEWVFVDAASGRPRSIPEEVMTGFEFIPDEVEPESESPPLA